MAPRDSDRKAGDAALGGGGAGGRGGHEKLMGPAGRGAAFTGWDSAILDLRADGSSSPSAPNSFRLELWRFHEAWLIPADAPEPPDGGRPRASVLDREERRATVVGSIEERPANALTFRGFSKAELNQTFVEVPERDLNGQPTWWSQDGRFFFYYAPQYFHWKANAVRSAGGDGAGAVHVGGRRDGCGFAHSGQLLDDSLSPSTVLSGRGGWHELSQGDWAPVEPEITAAEARDLQFNATSVEVEVLATLGEKTSRFSRVSGPITFSGLRLPTASSASRPGQGGAAAEAPVLLLSLPWLDDAEAEGDAGSADDQVAPNGGDGETVDGQAPQRGADTGEAVSVADGLGDPTALLLEPAKEERSKL